MKGSSVGEYLIMFGALIAVIATAVISLGRLVVFQAETAEQKYAQSIADEIASVISEVSASPDGAYYVLDPTRTRYNISITPTRVVLDYTKRQAISTHVGRDVIPISFNSTDTLCIQKSLGRILVKSGECLSCADDDGFCDAGCDALGACDSDCIISSDGYCSKSCSSLQDEKCDLDCVGGFDGIWDPDCGCQLSAPDLPSPRGLCPSGPCQQEQACDLDSGTLDFSWDPCCVGEDLVCDPDYDAGCDPDCVNDLVCRGTCESDPSICFPSCGNPACDRCGYSCAPGCSSRPPGWDSELPCRAELPDSDENATYPVFLKIPYESIEADCGMNATRFEVFHLGTQVPAGAFFENGASYLVYPPYQTGMQAYFGEGEPVTPKRADLLAFNGTLVNGFIKIVAVDGIITHAFDAQTAEELGGPWGYQQDEPDYDSASTDQNVTVGAVSFASPSGSKTYQVFSGLPGVRMRSSDDSPCFWDFPEGYVVSSDGGFGYAEAGQTLMLYCKGASVIADPSERRLSCDSREAWLLSCSDCQPARDWLLHDKDVQAEGLMRLENATGYSPLC